jgi:hypothetical protein
MFRHAGGGELPATVRRRDRPPFPQVRGPLLVKIVCATAQNTKVLHSSDRH